MRAIKPYGMDTKSGGGIHLWLKGFVYKVGTTDTISVHFTRDEAIEFVEEILGRIIEDDKKRFDLIMKKVHSMSNNND